MSNIIDFEQEKFDREVKELLIETGKIFDEYYENSEIYETVRERLMKPRDPDKNVDMDDAVKRFED